MTNQGQPDLSANALFERILDAGKAVRPYVSVTPLYCSGPLSEFAGAEVNLKAEHIHQTGSFKLRGAVNKLRCLDAAAKKAGVLTASSGNHGLGLAKAGAELGVSVTVQVAKSASPLKVAAIKALGAKLVEVDGPPIAAELLARAQGEQTGQHYVSPYNDIDVIAGQGSIGLELFAQRPDLDVVYISVGGGLISGVGSALKKLSPRTRIVGVWPQNSPCLLRALEAGEIVNVEESHTISDGTAGAVEPGCITLPISKAVIDETTTVTEEEIRAAMHNAERIIEGAAGVAVAGLLKSAERNRGRRVAAIVCGRNIELGKFLDAIRESGQSSNDGWRSSPGNKLDSEPRP